MMERIKELNTIIKDSNNKLQKIELMINTGGWNLDKQLDLIMNYKKNQDRRLLAIKEINKLINNK